MTLAFGRRYGLVGRNGTGKTTFLRHLAAHLIKGIPKNVQILHVEQEVRSSSAENGFLSSPALGSATCPAMSPLECYL